MESSSLYKQHLQKLYNQNTIVEDSQLTSFSYLKTLALQFLRVIFVLVSLIAVMLDYFATQFDNQGQLDLISMLFTLLTMATIVFQRLAVIQWLKQKKDYQNKPKYQIALMFLQIILLIPTPNSIFDDQSMVSMVDINGNTVQFKIQQLLAAYVTVRTVYFLRFLIHFQLYYGSRPDRLSRLYTVKFGTFNAFKFLINQKPHFILMVIFILNYLLLPLQLLLIQGRINPDLDNFIACVYYQVVTQVTVGYGDITVITTLGRVIMVISIIIGITTASILLIFFMRLMEQDTNQEQSHALLGILQKKEQLTKAMVERLETQVSCLNRKVPIQKKEQYQEKLNEFKFKNARKIRFQKETAPNLKRMMMGNFAALLEGINELKQTEIMLGKYIKIIQNSNQICPEFKQQ